MPAASFDIDIPPVRVTRDLHRPSFELLVRVLAGTCLGGLVVVAAVLLARRAAGGITVALAPTTLLCVGSLLASLAALAQWPHRTFLRSNADSRIHVVDVLGFGAPLLVASLLAAAMTLPGTSVASASLLWLPLVASQVAIAWFHFGGWSVSPRAAAATDESDLSPTQPDEMSPRENAAMPLTALSLAAAPVESFDEQMAPNVMQQWARRLEDDFDVLEGFARAEFSMGARVTNLHVGVCPPFAAAPEVFVETTDGPTATVKVAEALPFGLRLEIRLAQTAETDCDVVVAVVARSVPRCTDSQTLHRDSELRSDSELHRDSE